MKKSFSQASILILLSFAFSLSSCNFDDTKNELISIFTRKGPIERNRSLSLDQLQQYKQLTSALITLDEKFIEELEKISPEDRQGILTNMRSAREKLVKKYKFKDYEEYLWIDSVALQDPNNWAIAKSAGISIVKIK